jgi:hypothetical protein
MYVASLLIRIHHTLFLCVHSNPEGQGAAAERNPKKIRPCDEIKSLALLLRAVTAAWEWDCCYHSHHRNYHHRHHHHLHRRRHHAVMDDDVVVMDDDMGVGVLVLGSERYMTSLLCGSFPHRCCSLLSTYLFGRLFVVSYTVVRYVCGIPSYSYSPPGGQLVLLAWTTELLVSLGVAALCFVVFSMSRDSTLNSAA